MNFWALSGLINGITSSIFGLFVYLKNRKSSTNRLCAICSLTVAFWSYSYFFWQISTEKSQALFWCRSLMVGAIFIPVTFLHFLLVWLDLIHTKKKILFISYGLSFIAFVLNFTPFFIKEVSQILFFKYWPRAGFTYLPFLVFWIWIVFYSIYIMIQAMHTASSIKRTQIKYVLLGVIIGFIGGFTNYPLWFGIKILPYGNILVPIYVGLMSYAIIKYRLLDITIVLTRAGVFAFVYTLVLGIPFGMGGLVKPSLSKITSNWWLFPVFLMAILASAGPFIYMRLQKRIESRLRAQEFKSHDALRRLSHNMLRFTNLEVLLKLIVHYLVKILRLKFAAIYIFDSQSDKYSLKSSWQIQEKFNLPESFPKDSSLIKDLFLRRLPIATEELRLVAPKAPFSSHIPELLNTLIDLKINTVIPSFLRNGLLGFLIISDRKNNLTFSQEDLNLLMVLSNESALAIENAQFHQKEKSILAEKSRREALADMAPGASHQFNNRLAAISSSTELMLLRLENLNVDSLQDENLKSILKQTRNTLELIDKEVYKGKEITTAILKRAKAKQDFQEVNIQTIIENSYRLVLISRSKSGLETKTDTKFELILLSEIPSILASEALLQDCHYNLFDNSLDAIDKIVLLISQGELTPKESPFQGRIVVSLKQEEGFIIIQLTDNGIGLTKEQKRRLFTPYFTTKATSGKGTGLGLYVIRDFIEMHQGTITCESEYGEGTTFTIRLPIRQKYHK